MANAQIHPISSATTDSFRDRMLEHSLNGVRLLGDGPREAVCSITSHIQALALAVEAAHYKTGGGESGVDDMNPEIMAGALSGIAYLASLANFMNSEADWEHK